MFSYKTRIVVGALTIAIAVVGTATPAIADDGNDPSKEATAIYFAPVAQTIYFSRSATTPATHAVQPLDTIYSIGTLADSRSSNIHPNGGSTAALATGYKSTVSKPSPISTTLTGTSYGQWLGATPVNATSMKLSDTWSVAAVSSVSIGFPPGISGSISGNSASWTTSLSNTWKLTHSFNGISFSGALISETEDSAVVATFGGQSFLVNN